MIKSPIKSTGLADGLRDNAFVVENPTAATTNEGPIIAPIMTMTIVTKSIHRFPPARLLFFFLYPLFRVFFDQNGAAVVIKTDEPPQNADLFLAVDHDLSFSQNRRQIRMKAQKL